nr:uncharacterized protein LOC128686352 [Cherax quadricarinatus]
MSNLTSEEQLRKAKLKKTLSDLFGKSSVSHKRDNTLCKSDGTVENMSDTPKKFQASNTLKARGVKSVQESKYQFKKPLDFLFESDLSLKESGQERVKNFTKVNRHSKKRRLVEERYTPQPLSKVIVKKKSRRKSKSEIDSNPSPRKKLNTNLEYKPHSSSKRAPEPEYQPKSIRKFSSDPEYKPHSLSKHSLKPEYKPLSISKGSLKLLYKPKSITKGTSRPEYEPKPIRGSLWTDTGNECTLKSFQNRIQNKEKLEEADRVDMYVPKPLSKESAVKEYIPKPMCLPPNNVEQEDEYSPHPVGLDKPTPEYIPSGICESTEHEEEYVPLPPKNKQSADNVGDSVLLSPVVEGNSQHILEKNSSTPILVKTSINTPLYAADIYNQCSVTTHTGEKIAPGFYREQDGNSSHEERQNQNSGTVGKGTLPKNQRQGPSKKSEVGKQKTKPPGPEMSKKCSKILMYIPPPPTFDMILSTLGDYNLPEVLHPPAFCSKPGDIPSKPVEIGGQVLKLKSGIASDLEDFEGRFQEDGLYNWRLLLKALNSEASIHVIHESAFLENRGKTECSILTPVKPPPSPEEVIRWTKARKIFKSIKKKSDHDDKDNDDDDDPSSSKKQNKASSDSKNHNSKSCNTSTSQETRPQKNSSDGLSDVHAETTNLQQLKTSTPQPKISYALEVLHLTPIEKISSPSAEKLSQDKRQCQERSTKRRVSWEGKELKSGKSPIIYKRRRTLFEELNPLEEESEDQINLELKPNSKKSVSFDELMLKSLESRENSAVGSVQLAEYLDNEGNTSSKTDTYVAEVDSRIPVSAASIEGTKVEERTILSEEKKTECQPTSEDYPDNSQSLLSHISLSLTSKITSQQSSQHSNDSSLRQQLMNTQFRQQFLSFSQGKGSFSQVTIFLILKNKA